MIFDIEFDNDETYSSDGPALLLGNGRGHGRPEGYRIEDGFVFIHFGGTVFRKIPQSRLIRITDF